MGKKHLLGTVAAVGLSLGMASAKAADMESAPEPASWYVSFFGGATWLDDVDTDYDAGLVTPFIEHNDAITDTGMIIGGALGTRLTDDLRIQIEVAYSENQVDHIHYASPRAEGDYDATGAFGMLTFMANVWYDIPVSDLVTPYLGGGAGVAIIDGDTRYSGGFKPYNSSETAFAFQAGAGLRFVVLDNVTLDLGYRLRGVDSVTFGNSQAPTFEYDTDTIISHNFIGGVSVGLSSSAWTRNATADEPAGGNLYYVSLFGGASFPHDVDATQNYDSQPDYDYSLNLKSGYIVGGAIGKRIADPLRAEVEASYARWEARDFEGQGDTGGDEFSGDAHGHLSAIYLLANLWFDINTDTSFTPYLGGGAGAAWVDADTTFAEDQFGYSEGQMGFACQLGGGVKFDLSQSIAFDIGYRFKGITDIDFDARGESTGVNPYEGADIYSHNVQGGVIFSF